MSFDKGSQVNRPANTSTDNRVVNAKVGEHTASFYLRVNVCDSPFHADKQTNQYL